MDSSIVLGSFTVTASRGYHLGFPTTVYTLLEVYTDEENEVAFSTTDLDEIADRIKVELVRSIEHNL